MKILDFPELVQTYDYDCGAKALQAVLAYYGIEKHEDVLMIAAKTNKEHGSNNRYRKSITVLQFEI